MKYMICILTVLILVSCTTAQVQVPAMMSDLKPLYDSLAAHRQQDSLLQAQNTMLRAQVVALLARPTYLVSGDTTTFLNGANRFSRAVLLKTWRGRFAGNAARLAIYVPGIDTSWTVGRDEDYSTETPYYDFVKRMVKRDTVVYLRTAVNGTIPVTPNLPVDGWGFAP